MQIEKGCSLTELTKELLKGIRREEFLRKYDGIEIAPDTTANQYVYELESLGYLVEKDGILKMVPV